MSNSVQDAKEMKEAIAKLAMRVETLEQQAVMHAVRNDNGGTNEDLRQVLAQTLARLKEIHAQFLTGFNMANEQLQALETAEGTVVKQVYQIKHLKRALEEEEKKKKT